jgi:carbon-monoxide dehydrogenase medium subunit
VAGATGRSRRFVLDTWAEGVREYRMLLRQVAYARPASVDEALGLLAAREDARPLAGGQTLLNVMKARIASPEVLVDLNGLEELRAIRTGANGALELGSMATYTDVILSPEVAEARPILAEVSSQIADVQVRNRGTVGGNVCSNDPTNHLPPLFAALGATMTIAGPDGPREVPADEFFLGVYVTAAGPGDLLTKVSVPGADGARDGFASVPIGRDGTCIVNAAATLRDGRARIAIGCVAATPVVLEADAAHVSDAVRGAGLEPPDDVHASADYRRHLAEVCAARAVRRAEAR